MPYLLDAVVFTAASGGTGSFTVSAALTGYRTPVAAGAVDGRTYRYRAQSSDLSEWEIGTATASSTGTVFSRTVLYSSTGGTVNFTNPPTVAITMTAAEVLQFEEAMSLTATQKAQARANIDVLKKNYIVNGAMMVSQERGTTSGTAVNYYAVDQFFLSHSNAGTQTVAQVASVTPGGSSHRYRFTCTASDAAVAAGDYSGIFMRLEGVRVADLLIGTASAKTVTLQFGCKGPAGTYCVSFRNSAVNRTYVAEYVISGGEANTDVIKTITLTLDTAGTWLTNNGTGLIITWILMAGTTYQTSPDAWTASGAIATSNQFNFMGTNANVFELFDVGLYEGSDAPDFMVPDFASELLICKRYWQSSYDYGVAPGTTWTQGLDQYKFSHPTAAFSSTWSIPPMRADPTLTFYDAAGNSGVVTYFASGAWSNSGAITSQVGKENFAFVQHNIASSTFTNFAFKADARL